MIDRVEFELRATPICNMDKDIKIFLKGYDNVGNITIPLVYGYVNTHTLVVALPYKDTLGVADIVLAIDAAPPNMVLKKIDIYGMGVINSVYVCGDMYIGAMVLEGKNTVFVFKESDVSIDGIVYDYDTWEQQY